MKRRMRGNCGRWPMNGSNEGRVGRPLTAAAALLGCLLLGPAASRAATVEIRFATIAPDGTPCSDQVAALKKRIEAEGGGRIGFKPNLGGQLGGEVETLRSLQRGRIQAWGGSIG